MKAMEPDQIHEMSREPAYAHEHAAEDDKVLSRRVMRKARAGGERAESASGRSGFADAINAGLISRAGDGDIASDASVKVSRAAESAGHALPNDLRGQFEQSLGADLGGVRVHTHSAAADASDALGARAYAVGQDVFMGAGEYNPSSPDGAFLLAHEVAHTVQQKGASAGPQCKLEVSEPSDALESAADEAAQAMVLGRTAPGVGSVGARNISRYRRNVTNWGGQIIGSDASYIDLIPAAEVFYTGSPRVQHYHQFGAGATSVHIPAGSSGHIRVRLHISYNITRIGHDDNGATEYVAGMSYECDSAGRITWTEHLEGPVSDPIQSAVFNLDPGASGSGNTMAARFQFQGPQMAQTAGFMPEGIGAQATHTGAARGFRESYLVNVIVDGAQQAPQNNEPSGGSNTNNNTNTNTNTNNNSAQGGQGGQGGSAHATGGSSNVTVNVNPAAPAPAPQQQAPAPNGPELDYTQVNFNPNDDHGSENVRAAIQRWLAGLPESTRSELQHNHATFVVWGFASRRGSESLNESLAERRARNVMRILRLELARYGQIHFDEDSGGMGESTAAGDPNRNDAQEQRVEIRIRQNHNP